MVLGADGDDLDDRVREVPAQLVHGHEAGRVGHADDDALQAAVRQHVGSRQRGLADREARERYGQLSPREREVLGLIVAGLTNKEIGRALGLSPRTVETHRAHLFGKLGAPTLAQLILRYAQLAEDDAAAGA